MTAITRAGITLALSMISAGALTMTGVLTHAAEEVRIVRVVDEIEWP
ncbi:hypothetical protein [Streptomyces sp. NPDC102264]